jgi:hypothetical protein
MELWYHTNGVASLDECADAAQASFAHEVDISTDGFSWDTDRAGAQERLDKLVRHVIDNGHTWDLDLYTVLATEQQFDYPWVTIGDVEFVAHGTIDLILMGPDGWVNFVDHKTAGRKWREGREKPRQTAQPVWYVTWGMQWFNQQYPEDVAENGMRDALFTFDVASTSPKQGKPGFERRPAPFTPYQAGVVMEKAKQYAGVLAAGGPYIPAVTHYLCDHRWCDHWYHCPFGEDFAVK